MADKLSKQTSLRMAAKLALRRQQAFAAVPVT
jgi:hypothetical protein